MPDVNNRVFIQESMQYKGGSCLEAALSAIYKYY